MKEKNIPVYKSVLPPGPDAYRYQNQKMVKSSSIRSLSSLNNVYENKENVKVPRTNTVNRYRNM